MGNTSLTRCFYLAHSTLASLKMNDAGDKSDVLIVIPKQSQSVR